MAVWVMNAIDARKRIEIAYIARSAQLIRKHTFFEMCLVSSTPHISASCVRRRNAFCVRVWVCTENVWCVAQKHMRANQIASHRSRRGRTEQLRRRWSCGRTATFPADEDNFSAVLARVRVHATWWNAGRTRGKRFFGIGCGKLWAAADICLD